MTTRSAGSAGILLAPDEVVPFLWRRGLVTAEHVLDGAFEVVDVSRRNRNFKVISERGPCYLVKQGPGAERARTVANEAALYEFVHRLPAGGELLKLLPGLHMYEASEGVLVLELVPGGRSLMDVQRSRRRLPARLAGALGATLGTLHHETGGEALARLAHRFGAGPPFGLSLHRPDLQLFSHASQGSIELVRVVQRSPALVGELDRLAAEWRAECLVHGDVRWDNCAVVPPASGRGRALIKLVDWELAGVGDPGWDVGGVFSEYLSHWVLSAPLSASTPPEDYLRFALTPLERTRPSVRAFWAAYTSRSRLGRSEVGERLLRAVRYAAARLVQTAFERANTGTVVTGQSVLLVQLGQNLLERPLLASTQLLGLAP